MGWDMMEISGVTCEEMPLYPFSNLLLSASFAQNRSKTILADYAFKQVLGGNQGEDRKAIFCGATGLLSTLFQSKPSSFAAGNELKGED